MSEATKQNVEYILEYHAKTKHHLSGYAKGPDTIDWSAQPEAFRHYAGAETFDLPFTLDSVETTYDQLFSKVQPQQLTLATLSGLLELSLGLSAWKQYGPDSWAVRCNPSSGNLHPTEGYVLLNNMAELPDGIYHYCPDQHQLEQRCDITLDDDSGPTALICLSSIHWREAWKYGERAFRYSQLDIGHAMASMRYAAACYGWQVEPNFNSCNEIMDSLFGFDRKNDYIDNEPEKSEVLLKIKTGTNSHNIALNTISTDNWHGVANKLDKKHFYDWPIISEVNKASESPAENSSYSSKQTSYPIPLATTNELATTIIKQRRSAQLFDGQTIMPEDVFWRCIDKTLARRDNAPFDMLPWQARIHPVIFIHRVENIDRGLYVLPRHSDALEQLKKEFRPEFSYDKKEYEHLIMYKLVQANCEKAAKTLFCHQDIASQSAFSVGLLAEFHEHLVETPWQYRQLFWEAGVLGQALYLEAEANNFRATGVGCYFDDNFHETLGLKTEKFQSVYHFTVGTPVIDQRLVSLSGYHHIKRGKK